MVLLLLVTKYKFEVILNQEPTTAQISELTTGVLNDIEITLQNGFWSFWVETEADSVKELVFQTIQQVQSIGLDVIYIK